MADSTKHQTPAVGSVWRTADGFEVRVTEIRRGATTNGRRVVYASTQDANWVSFDPIHRFLAKFAPTKTTT